MKRKTIDTTWEVWVYDVWGNAKDGYEVNNRFCTYREFPLKLKIQVANPGSPQQFEWAAPSDTQIRGLFGVECNLSYEGDDISIYVIRTRDDCPIGELHCLSHNSLSPIKGKGEK